MTTETDFGTYTAAQVAELQAQWDHERAQRYTAAEVEDVIDVQRALCLAGALLLTCVGSTVTFLIGLVLGWWLL